ncbi:hypothetical protein HDU93_008602 [Gonapodya sp. JEL0774]|nr:hypothetical protein HDU93_008602 [Gonapodya sp. JEL0774]
MKLLTNTIQIRNTVFVGKMTQSTVSLSIRPATLNDVPIVASFLKSESSLSQSDLAAGFKNSAFPGDDSRPIAGAAIAEENGKVIGVAVYTDWFSTWQGRPILDIQHLSVLPEHSLRQVWRPLMKHLAGIAIARRATRMQWHVAPVGGGAQIRELSKELGAHEMPDWLDVVVGGDQLLALARRTEIAPSPTDQLRIRPAEPRDVKTILRFVRELAEFEKLPDEAKASPEDIEWYHFPTDGKPVTETVIAEWRGKEIGFAMWLTVWDPVSGAPSLYLEDLYVTPESRSLRVGSRLLAHLASIAVARGYPTYRWQVLDWNHGAIGFYEKMGGKVGSGKIMTRVEGNLLAELSKADYSY